MGGCEAVKREGNWTLGGSQGCRKLAPLATLAPLAPLAPPVPDKSHLVGQNEILKKKILDIL